ncbi:MAG TPA: hypothetical protein VEU30_06025, partial [Thermoanaerobaculia bacterium]|nr:hypothetical protein [Thermoanaerobaculia bacterium]
MLWPLLLIHISGAMIGLLSGAMAMLFRKGSGLHGAAGSVFFVSMLAMTSTGAVIAAFLKPNSLNLTVSLLTFYLVSTAWWAAKHREVGRSRFDRGALLFILLVGLLGLSLAVQDSRYGGITVFFSVAALFAAARDIRMIRRGGFSGPSRIARHLLRMCFALLIAVFSFYPGQARLFPMWVRDTGLMFVPHVLLIGAMIVSTMRVLRGRRR